MLGTGAKRTCWGPHMIPCYRYHQALHIIGHQQGCTYCVAEKRAHDQRLGQLITEAQLLFQEASTGNSGLVKCTPPPAPTPSTSATTTADKKPPATKKEKKALKHQAKAHSRAAEHASAITREQLDTTLAAAKGNTTTALASILQQMGLSTTPKTRPSKPAAKALDELRALVAAELAAQQTIVDETAWRKAGFEAIVPRSTLDALAARNAVWRHDNNERIKLEEDKAGEEPREEQPEEVEKVPAVLPTPPPSPELKAKGNKRQRR